MAWTLWRHWFVGVCIAAVPAALLGALSPALGFIVFFAIIGAYLYLRAQV